MIYIAILSFISGVFVSSVTYYTHDYLFQSKNSITKSDKKNGVVYENKQLLREIKTFQRKVS